MRLTRKFWAWIGQLGMLFILLLRVDLVVQLFKLVPNADMGQLYPLFAGVGLLALGWFAWLIYCAYRGFGGEMNFFFDPNDRRQ